MQMAEEHLRRSRVAENAWPGRKFRYTENLTGGMWASVVIEVERRGDQWIVTRLDRNRTAAPDAETGFREL